MFKKVILLKGGAIGLKQYDIIVIGGGVAGMAAAISAREKGTRKILILEREDALGGVLNLCIHNGFGRKILDDEVTGPEYAQFLIDKIDALSIEYKLNSLVLDLTRDKIVTYVNPDEGIIKAKGKCIILASGSREKFTGNINIATHKFAGIYTVGTAQKFVNTRGYLPGKNIVIIGTSDITIAIARRLLLEGAEIKALVEKKPFIIAKRKKIKQIVEDFNIPVMLSNAVIDVKGKDRIEEVTIAPVDEKGQVINGEIEKMECDCLLLSVGWVPESELAEKARLKISEKNLGLEVNEKLETSQLGIYACGNVVHSYSYADDTTLEGYEVGKQATNYLKIYHSRNS